MKRHLFMKKFMIIILTLTLAFNTGVSAFAKQINNNDTGKDKVNLIISNIPEKQILPVNYRWTFLAQVDTSSKDKGKNENGIIGWEIRKDTAKAWSEKTKVGVVCPKQTGSFQVRAVYFQNEKNYTSWLKDKEKNKKLIISSSKWLTITVKLYSSLKLTLNGDEVIFLHVGDTYVDPGATAYDQMDGDVTGRIETTYCDIDMNHTGTYFQIYQVKNPYYDVIAARQIIVSEADKSVAPVFTNFYDGNLQMVKTGSKYIPRRIQAYDDKDGNISDKVVIGGDVVDIGKEGVYYVTYNVRDSEGLSAIQFTLPVVVTNLDIPTTNNDSYLELGLIGSSFINLEVGDTYIEPGYHAIDGADGDLTNSVQIKGSVDTSVAGLYILTYKVVDSAGMEAVQFRCIQVN